MAIPDAGEAGTDRAEAVKAKLVARFASPFRPSVKSTSRSLLLACSRELPVCLSSTTARRVIVHAYHALHILLFL